MGSSSWGWNRGLLTPKKGCTGLQLPWVPRDSILPLNVDQVDSSLYSTRTSFQEVVRRKEGDCSVSFLISAFLPSLPSLLLSIHTFS